jgi:hypothetical protein
MTLKMSAGYIPVYISHLVLTPPIIHAIIKIRGDWSEYLPHHERKARG